MHWVSDPFGKDVYRELLGRGAVHVWRVALGNADDVPDELVTAGPLLSSDEHQRADRFRRAGPRSTYVQTRTALRVLLGAYLECHPATIRLTTSEHGKPGLAAPADAWLRFSVSHSGSYAVIAFARERSVGVDVERVRDEIDCDSLAQAYFAPAEAAELAQVPAAVRRAAFFACWTRKESILKAIGSGLSTPLNSFRVSVAPGDAPALVDVSGWPAESARWALCDLSVAPGYAAALAVECPMPAIRRFDYSHLVAG